MPHRNIEPWQTGFVQGGNVKCGGQSDLCGDPIGLDRAGPYLRRAPRFSASSDRAARHCPSRRHSECFRRRAGSGCSALAQLVKANVHELDGIDRVLAVPWIHGAMRSLAMKGEFCADRSVGRQPVTRRKIITEMRPLRWRVPLRRLIQPRPEPLAPKD
jgi:hypothetical protein